MAPISTYHRPGSLQEALELLARPDTETRILGGGTVINAAPHSGGEIVDLQALLEGLAQRPLQLWNLQVGPDRQEGQVAGVRWGAALAPDADFLVLAQQLQQLDLLICVDTAAAHLAGAMGMEAWVLLPWAAASRWQRHSTTTTWYPSLRLWRQPRHGDWLGLWPDLLAALAQRLASRSWKSAS